MDELLELAQKAAAHTELVEQIKKRPKHVITLKRTTNGFYTHIGEKITVSIMKRIMDKNKAKIKKFKAGTDKLVKLW